MSQSSVTGISDFPEDLLSVDPTAEIPDELIDDEYPCEYHPIVSHHYSDPEDPPKERELPPRAMAAVHKVTPHYNN